MTRKQRPPSPAALALAEAGSSITELGEALGVSSAAASRYLSGERAKPMELKAALMRLVGRRRASEVLKLIPERPRWTDARERS
jgi:predicted transcriptional regulator